MKQKKILNILRNPYGRSTDQIRAARLAVCDLIEKQEKEIIKISKESKKLITRIGN